MHGVWSLYHWGWLVYDLGRFVRHPNGWTALALALTASWWLVRRRR